MEITGEVIPQLNFLGITELIWTKSTQCQNEREHCKEKKPEVDTPPSAEERFSTKSPQRDPTNISAGYEVIANRVNMGMQDCFNTQK